MKIAIFGGSFNPIHNAHVKLSRRFVDEIGLDVVYFVPTYVTPLKDNSNFIDAYHRLSMCEIALEDYDDIKVSDVEIKRAGMSYSSDTIAYFKDRFSDAQLYFIMGADMFMTLEKWHNFEYIFENVTILTTPRDDCDYDTLLDKFLQYKKYSCKAYFAKEIIEDLSSTQIRGMIKEGRDVSKYLCPKVALYIDEHNLYR